MSRSLRHRKAAHSTNTWPKSIQLIQQCSYSKQGTNKGTQVTQIQHISTQKHKQRSNEGKFRPTNTKVENSYHNCITLATTVLPGTFCRRHERHKWRQAGITWWYHAKMPGYGACVVGGREFVGHSTRLLYFHVCRVTRHNALTDSTLAGIWTQQLAAEAHKKTPI